MTVSNADFLGWYAVSFDGHVHEGGMWLPVSAVGLVHADGIGGLQLWRMLCHPSLGPLQQTGRGSYTSNGGIRSAALTITTVSLNNATTKESFEFVLSEENDDLQFISSGAAGQAPTSVVRGHGTRTATPATPVFKPVP